MALQTLVNALGQHSTICYPLLLPVLQHCTDLSQVCHQNLWQHPDEWQAQQTACRCGHRGRHLPGASLDHASRMHPLTQADAHTRHPSKRPHSCLPACALSACALMTAQPEVADQGMKGAAAAR